jgi:ATP-dependent Clp protease adaptor protein ClpS
LAIRWQTLTNCFEKSTGQWRFVPSPAKDSAQTLMGFTKAPDIPEDSRAAVFRMLKNGIPRTASLSSWRETDAVLSVPSQETSSPPFAIPFFADSGQGRSLCYSAAVADTATPEVLPTPGIDAETGEETELDPGYLVICWDDPVNLMEYVTHVFQTVFGWSRARAERQMLQVHKQGKSVLTRETKEKAEHYVHQLQKYSLHATMERDAS